MSEPRWTSMKSLPAELALCVEEVCTRFERAWQEGRRPCVEECLGEAPEPARAALLRELIPLDVDYRRRQGASLSQGDYTHLFPDGVPEWLAGELAVCQLAGRFRLGAELGRGGMGVVYLAHDPDLGRDLAVKVVHVGASGEDLTRFEHEARVTAWLQHPNIPPVHDRGRRHDGRPYFAMKLVRGRTLDELLSGRSTCAEGLPRYLQVFVQVCQGVAHAHSRGVIHRDLKPHNVMVGEFGEVQVMDWGLAKLLTEREGGEHGEPTSNGRLEGEGFLSSTPALGHPPHATEPNRVMGSVQYMAPEQARGEVGQLDRRCDVFSLGAILCEILTGKPPYVGSTRDAVLRKAEAADLTEAWGRLDGCGAEAELVQLCRRCLAPRQADRPGDALQVAQAVTTYQEEVQRRLRQAEIHQHEAEIKAEEERKRREVEQAKVRIERHRRRWTLVAAGLSVLLLIGAAGGALWYQQVENQQALAEQRDRNRHDNRNRAVEEALAVVEANHGELHERLRARPYELLSNPNRGETLLRQAEEALRRAMLLRDNEPEPLEAELDQRLRDWQAKLQQERAPGRDNWVFLRRLDQIRQSAAVLVAGIPQPWKTALEYEKAFADLGYDFRNGDPDRLAAKIKATPIQAALVSALDDWVNSLHLPGAKDRSLESTLLEVARKSDPDPWRDCIRRQESWTKATLGQLAREVAVSRQPPQILVSLALRMHGQGLTPVPLLSRGLGQYPGDFWLHFHLAMYASVFKDAAKSEAHLLAALAIRPDSAMAWSGLGNAYDSQNKRAEAIDAYKKALAIDDQDAIAWSNLGAAYDRQDKLPEAVDAFKKALAIDQNAKDWYNLGLTYDRQDKLPEAVDSFKKALTIDDRFGAAWYHLGAAYDRQDKLPEAADAFKKALAIDDRDAVAWRNLGTSLARQDKLSEAIDAYKKALAIDDQDAIAWYNLGLTYDRQDKLPEAIDAYKKALAVDDRFGAAWRKLGPALARQDKLPEAVDALKKALAVDDRFGAAWRNLGTSLARQDKLSEAIDAYKKALAIDDQDAIAWYNLGLTYDSQNKRAEAIDAYKKALAIDDQDAIAWSNLGVAYHMQDKLPEAIDAYKKALTIDDQDANAHANLGLAYQQLGRFAEAAQALQNALSKLPVRDPARPAMQESLQNCERLLQLDRLLPMVLNGPAEPATPAEGLELASLCRHPSKRLHATAARLAADAFAGEPKLAGDLQLQHRYNAACSAALAAAGQAEDAKLQPDRLVLALRRQSLTWLRADLAAYAGLVKGDPQAKALVRQRLAHWQQDADFASVRDKEALDRLPEDERTAWQHLWDDVEAVRKLPQAK